MNSLPYTIPDAKLPLDNFAINAYMNKWKKAASINTASPYWNPTTKLTDAQYTAIRNAIKADYATVESQMNTLTASVHKALNNTAKEIDFITANSYKIGNTTYKSSSGKTLRDLMIDWKNIKQANNTIQYELRFNLKSGYSLLV